MPWPTPCCIDAPRTVKKPLAIILPVLLLAGGLAAILMRSPDTVRNAEALTVYFTCDTHGRLEPCGCFTGQYGGLTRLDTWLGHHRAPGTLLVDVGGAIAGREDYHLIQYRYVLKACGRMGFHAMNLGGAEAELDANTLRELAATSPVPLVSASLVDAATREPLARPTAIVETNGRRIGFLGVLDPRSVRAPGRGVAVLPLDDAISRHLPTLAGQCDTLVLLAFAPELEMQRLAREYYEFPLILGGDVKQASQSLRRENQSAILFTTNQARTVGEVVLRPVGDALAAESFDIHMLYPNISQSEEIAELAVLFRREVRATPLAIDDPEALTANSIPGVQPVATFLGTDSCTRCHQEEHQIWRQSKHARAFASLVRRQTEADPTCIGCHTIGFGSPSGYRRAFQGSKLVDVGCESCHGPGSAHVADHLANREHPFKFRPLGPGDCTTCHHGEFSRPFDWDHSWPPVAHGRDSPDPKPNAVSGD